MRCIAGNIGSLYSHVLEKLLRGSGASPRGLKTREVVGAHLTLQDPSANVLVSSVRKPNYYFMVAEWLWMMSGSNRVDLIEPFNKQIVMAQDEGQFSFAGAYGPKLVEQVPYVIDCLRGDPDSRQAVITVWRERPRASRDVPCTVSLQYLLRDGFLTAVTYMRSNDAWLGLPYDVYNFTQLQRFIAHHLGAQPGDYHHMVGSLHLYEQHFEKARAVIEDPTLAAAESLPFESDGLSRTLSAFYDLATGGCRDAMAAEWLRKYRDLPPEWFSLLEVLARRFWKCPPVYDRSPFAGLV